MQNIKLYIALLLISFTCVTKAQSLQNSREQIPVSFKSSALGNVISDDLDLIYDPIELSHIKNLQIYTNLSNLGSGKELVFNNSLNNDNSLLLGISRENPFMKNLVHSLLVTFQKTKSPKPVGLNTNLTGTGFDQIGNGFLENIMVRMFDTGGDGLYDYKEEIRQNTSWYKETNKFNIIINNSYIRDNMTFGFRFAVGNNNNSQNNANYWNMGTEGRLLGYYYGAASFDRDYTQYDLKANAIVQQFKEKGQFETKQENPYLSVKLSAAKELSALNLRDIEVRADLQYTKFESKTQSNDIYTGTQKDFVSNLPLFYKTNDKKALNQKKDNIQGGAIAFGLEGRWTFIKGARRVYDGFVKTRIEYAFESYDKNVSSNVFYSTDKVTYDPTSVSYGNANAVSSSSEQKDDGSGKKHAFLFSTIVNTPVSEDIFFGIGLVLTSFSVTNDLKYSESELSDNITSTLLGAGTKELEYATHTSKSQMSDHTNKLQVTDVRIPVGIEFKLTEKKNWMIRFGSLFHYQKEIQDDAHQITSSLPYTEVTTSRTGYTTVRIEANRNLSVNSQKITDFSETLYTYGIGYLYNDNLQIDINGFFEADNNVTLLEYCKLLRLSFVLKW